MKLFPAVRQKNCYGKSLYSALIQKPFRYQEFSETQKGSSKKVFGTVGKNISTEYLDTPASLIPNHFTTGSFLKHSTKGFPSDFFGTAKQKKTTRNRHITLLSINYCHTRN